MNVSDLEAALNDLQYLAVGRFKTQEELKELSRSGLSSGQEDEQRTDLQSQIENKRNQLIRRIQNVLKFPPCHSRHFSRLAEFWSSGSYERSVFIMTKFPEGDGVEDLRLKEVHLSLRKAVGDCGFVPRMASDVEYHSALWDNVEIYLLGCAQGIALVEDKYKPELNPNVAMEWGWMRGMDRRVYFLVEESFRNMRADVTGLLREQFAWKLPEPGIAAAVRKWLGRPQ